MTGDATGAVSSATKKMLVAQIVKEHVRQHQLRDQLKALRDALQKDKKNPIGRVIVLIDELDRCRPDYAISLLEAIKHLFGVDGFIFVLMLNNDQLERTAAHLYGETENAEPYLAKFVDYRLRLPLEEADRAYFAKWRAAQIDFTPVNEADHFSRESFIASAGEPASSSDFSLRQLDRIFLNVDVALKCLAGDETADASYLAYLSFDRASLMYVRDKKNNPARFSATPSIRFAAFDLTSLRWLLEGRIEGISDDATTNRRDLFRYFNGDSRSLTWESSRLGKEISEYDEWKARHEKLVDGVAALIVPPEPPKKPRSLYDNL